MKRIVPGKSNQRIPVIAKFTITDILYMLIFLTLFIVTLITMLLAQVKPFYLIAIPCVIEVVIPIIFLASINENRLYTYIYHMIRYMFRNKKIKSAKIETQLGIKFEKDHIKSQIGYSKILHIKGIDFNLISEDTQDIKIRQLSSVLASISNGKIIKMDTPLSFKNNLKKAFTRMKQYTAEYETIEDKNSIKALQEEARIYALDNDIKIFNALNMTSTIKSNNYFLILYNQNLNNLNNEVSYVIQELNKIGLSSFVLDEKELIDFYSQYYYLTASKNNENDKKYIPNITEKVKHLEIGENKICVNTLCEYPFTIDNAWLATISSFEDVRLVINFKKNTDTAKTIKRINKKIVSLGGLLLQRQSESDRLDIEGQIEAYQALLEQIKFSKENLHIVEIMIIYKYDRKITKLLSNLVRNNIKCKLDPLVFRQREAYANCVLHIPSKNMKSIQRDFQSSTFASSFPFISDLFIDKHGNYIGENSNPVFFDMFYNLNTKNSGTRTNANIMTIGASGKGKSYLQKILIKDALLDDNKVFILDPENEYSYIASMFGGNDIDVAGGDMRINPFEIFPELDDDGNKTKEYGALAKHLSFLNDFFKVVLPDISNYTRQVLQNILKEVYATKHIYNYGYFQEQNSTKKLLSELTSDDFPTFDDLIAYINNKDISTIGVQEKDAITELQAYMQDFTKDSRFGSIWNGKTTLSLDNDLVIFNFRGLDAGSSSEVKNGQMLLITKFLMKEIINNYQINLHKDKTESKRIVLCIDEAHNFIDPNFPVALDMMKNMAKRIRKYSGSLWVATQNIADFVGFDVNTKTKATAVINNCQYTFLFGLKPDDLNNVKEMYCKTATGALTDEELEYLITAGQGECLLLVDSQTRIAFHVALKDKDFETPLILPIEDKIENEETNESEDEIHYELMNQNNEAIKSVAP